MCGARNSSVNVTQTTADTDSVILIEGKLKQ